MDFQRGDAVVHPQQGVGVVTSIQAMDFPGKPWRDYYCVEFPRMTLWVPVSAEASHSLRPVTPKDQLSRFRSLLKCSPGRRTDNFRARHDELEQRKGLGTFGALCELVRDLTAWHRLKPLNDFERGLLSRSRSQLADEWSLTSGLEVKEVLDEIDGCLLKGWQLAAGD